jgi:hypothetical protein
MFWWFERDGALLRVEVLQLAADLFELRVIHADGREVVETFSNSDELARRQMQLQQGISDDGWTGPHGWVM